jgi:3,4-dihydroxy 2-butanone 4-phosphate synthase/GTP cyclohydrolase II
VGDANAQSDEPHADVDQLDYGTGSQILTDLGVTSMLLLTAHPERSYRLDPFGLSIAGVRTFERD